jgi:hypothetical protein
MLGPVDEGHLHWRACQHPDGEQPREADPEVETLEDEEAGPQDGDDDEPERDETHRDP